MKTSEKKSEQIKDIRLLLGLSQAEFAKALGMSVRNLQSYEWGKFDATESIKSESVIKRAEAIRLDFLMEANKSEDEPQIFNIKNKSFPVFNIQAQASNVGSFDDALSELPKTFVTVPGFEDCSFAVYVWNHSMYPTYENGCMVIVKEIQDKSAIQYGSVYLVITIDQRVVKRLYEDEDDAAYVLLASDNPELRKDGKAKYPIYKVSKESIKKLFLVKGTIKRTEI